MSNGDSRTEKTASVIINICLVLFSLLCIYPFYYMLIYSVSSPAEASSITWRPIGFTMSNFKQVIEKAGFYQAAVISLLRTVLGTLITVGCCSFFGYLVTKKNMVGRKFIYRLLVITMYFDAGIVPTYLVIKAYGLINNFWVYILPKALVAYYVVLIKTFVEQLPPSLEESATLDGAGTLRCWWSIVLPISKPIIATISVFSAVAQWNSWFDSHIYTTKDSLWSLQYILYRYLQEIQQLSDAILDNPGSGDMSMLLSVTPATVRMTITAIVTIPILLVYPFMQKYFIKGIQLGAVKE